MSHVALRPTGKAGSASALILSSPADEAAFGGEGGRR
jgi:hypothetical protein